MWHHRRRLAAKLFIFALIDGIATLALEEELRSMNETQPFIKNTVGLHITAASAPIGRRSEWRLSVANRLPGRGLWESCCGCSPTTRSFHWVKSHSRVCRQRCRGCREGRGNQRENNLRRARLFYHADDKNFTPNGESVHRVRLCAPSAALFSSFCRRVALHKRHRGGGLCCWLLAGSREEEAKEEGMGDAIF